MKASRERGGKGGILWHPELSQNPPGQSHSLVLGGDLAPICAHGEVSCDGRAYMVEIRNEARDLARCFQLFVRGVSSDLECVRRRSICYRHLARHRFMDPCRGGGRRHTTVCLSISPNHGATSCREACVKWRFSQQPPSDPAKYFLLVCSVRCIPKQILGGPSECNSTWVCGLTDR